MVKILIAEDHTIVRESLIKALTPHLPDTIFGEAGNFSAVMEKIQKENWDLMILDIKMPGRDGLDIIKNVTSHQPEIPILVLSMYPEDQFALRVIKAGASSYLTKNVSLEELIKAIKTILKGAQYITSSVARLLTKKLQHGNIDEMSHKSLSDREFQVFLLIAAGKNISDIALELSLSVKTISVYRAKILHKMNLKNNSEIIYFAFKNGLIQ